MTDFKVFKYVVPIKERHLDTFGHVNNATYLELLEEARWEFLHTEGIDLKSIHASGIGPVILECNIKFMKEIRLRESIVIESQMMSFENKIGVMRQDILDEQGNVCSEAKLTIGVFDMKIRKLILPPEQWRLALGGAAE